MDPGTDPGPDAGEPAPRVSYAGSYEVAAVWDLSGPLSADEGIGGTVAALMIDEIVGASGIPSSLQDRAKGKLSDVAHDPIRDYVNGKLPATLAPGGATMTELTQVLTSADVQSTITLSGTDALSGTDTLATITLAHEGDTLVLEPSDLAGGDVTIAASLSGSRTGSGFVLDDATYQIRFDVLVERAASDLLGVDTGAMASQIAGAIDCPAITTEITGGSGSVTITVAGEELSISASSITSGCNALVAELTSRALGLLARDTPIVLGGSVAAIDSDGDLRADRLTAGAGYGGTVAVVHPLLDPTIDARFTADRN